MVEVDLHRILAQSKITIKLLLDLSLEQTLIKQIFIKEPKKKIQMVYMTFNIHLRDQALRRFSSSY